MKKILQKLSLLFIFSLFLSGLSARDTFVVLDSCSVWLEFWGDSILFAHPTGEAPFTYAWSDGSTGSSILFPEPEQTYCVTITDATGCMAESCLDIPPYGIFNCSVSITYVTDSNYVALQAYPDGVPPFTYLWNDGSTGSAITYPNPGMTYCVSVTDATGCVASDCYEFWDTCYVLLEYVVTGDSSMLVATAFGIDGPPVYQWNTGSTDSVLINPEPGYYCVTLINLPVCQSVSCLDIAPLSVAESPVFKDFSLYPNPVGGAEAFFIEASLERKIDARLKLVNLQGQLVLEKPVSFRRGNNRLKFRADNLPSGMYFVFIYSDEGMLLSRKLLK